MHSFCFTDVWGDNVGRFYRMGIKLGGWVFVADVTRKGEGFGGYCGTGAL